MGAKDHFEQLDVSALICGILRSPLPPHTEVDLATFNIFLAQQVLAMQWEVIDEFTFRLTASQVALGKFLPSRGK